MTVKTTHSVRMVIIVVVTALGSAARGEEPSVMASASRGESGGRIAAEIQLRGVVKNPVKGNVYELYYQLRVHTKKGDLGAILGTADSPTGKAIFAKRRTGEDNTLYLDETIDVTRGGLLGMTNFKPWGKISMGGYYEMILRVEPHIYDVTQKKYISPAKTSAVILVADVSDEGKVVRLQPFADLLSWSGTDGRDPTKYLAMYSDLDEFDTLDNGIEGAYASVLASKTATPEVKLAFLKSMPKFFGKEAYALQLALDEILKGDDAKLKAAAQARLDEFKKP